MFCFVVGLDYVGHEDVLPYKTTGAQPINNQLFDKFLASDSTPGQSINQSIIQSVNRLINQLINQAIS